MNKIPTKIFVLIVAKISKPLDNFTANICVMAANIVMKIRNASIENTPNADVIIKNQKENPAVTANALNLDDEVFILNRIDESYQTTLC
jgi:hypothetical protein